MLPVRLSSDRSAPNYAANADAEDAAVTTAAAAAVLLSPMVLVLVLMVLLLPALPPRSPANASLRGDVSVRPRRPRRRQRQIAPTRCGRRRCDCQQSPMIDDGHRRGRLTRRAARGPLYTPPRRAWRACMHAYATADCMALVRAWRTKTCGAELAVWNARAGCLLP
eukprot:364938-Chlamydomonas_euryale.AAC.36